LYAGKGVLAAAAITTNREPALATSDLVFATHFTGSASRPHCPSHPAASQSTVETFHGVTVVEELLLENFAGVVSGTATCCFRECRSRPTSVMITASCLWALSRSGSPSLAARGIGLMTSMVDRRGFLSVVASSLLAPPLAGEALEAGKVYRIGDLGNYKNSPPTPGRPLRVKLDPHRV
jgi:hypothetical protein